ncbi:hypothetical protein M2310_006975 [Rhizobium leguminosarum]|uniref:Uncharacterized protein n=1 Tax=Rhizobium esperanzae TaxID=1967781 RepID=A0A7W6XYL8_9HYPH|nr:hypothetical protein [Rhizobium esperanzae]MDH6206283.1 hypothetical protein [Rhizobium leguminosarum]
MLGVRKHHRACPSTGGEQKGGGKDPALGRSRGGLTRRSTDARSCALAWRPARSATSRKLPLFNNPTGHAIWAIKRMTAVPCAQRSRKWRPRWAIPSNRWRKTERRCRTCRGSLRQTMPTSREIIIEVSGMSPNIGQLCLGTLHKEGDGDAARASHRDNIWPGPSLLGGWCFA